MFPQRLKELRKSANLTQKQLAEKLFVDQTSISYWETGKTKPDFDKQMELSTLFGVSLDYLRGISDTKKAPTVDEVDALPEAQALREVMESLSPEDRQRVLEFGRNLAATSHKPKQPK